MCTSRFFSVVLHLKFVAPANTTGVMDSIQWQSIFATHLAPPAASHGGLLSPHVDIDPSGVVVATICLFMEQVDVSVNW